MFTHRTSRPSGRAVVSLSVLQNPSEMSPRSAHSSSSEQSLRITGSCASDATPNSSPEQPLRRTRSHTLSAGSKTSSPFAEGGGAQRAGAEAATSIGWSSEDDITVSEDGSDFEETLRKMPKRNKMPFSKETVAAKRPRVATEKEIHQGYGGELFDAIRQGRSAMQVLVDDWLDSYKQDRQSGLLDLINFLMKACSCKGVVSREMLEQMQNADIIQKMTEDFNEESVDYPLSFSNPTWKKFRLNLGEFLETLMSYCQYSVIYDEFLMDSLISLLTGLSDSQVRAFRHTSTFAAMKLMTGLVKIARDLSINLENCNRQYDVERTKTPQKMAPERLESLLQKRKDLRENLEEIGNMMNGIFKGVFVHRYRDIVADIRAVCMEELGKWMRTHSQFFLNDSYLKYVGWTLHDKQGHVRLQCVRSLQSLYTMQDVAGRLELFTNRFKDRMVYMVLDKEQQVAVEAIKLLGLVSETMDNVLAEEDYETVYPLVFASSRAVSSEAGAFLYKRYLCNEATDSDAKDKSRRGSSVAFFKILVSFFIESDLHDQAAYLVDSLWESASAHLKDWECQTDLLLDGEGMDDRQENAFIEILVSAARQAVEGTSPIGRVPVKKVLSGKDRKAQAEDKLKLTRHMIVTLPHLLAKFSADAEKMCLLLMVIGYLDLEVYYTERLEKHLDLLLIQVRDILQKHTKPEVLESCSRALYFLCDREQNTYKRADIILSRMVDQLTDYFSQQVSDVLQVSDLDEDEVYNIAATMKRISALYSAHDLRRWELFEPCSLIIGKGIDTGVPEQVFLPALSCCYYSLLWDLWHLYSSAQQQQIDLSALKKRLCKFCDLCQSCLSDHHAAVREQAFILLSDLLIVFGGHIASGEKSHLQPLIMHPELPLQAEMAGLLLDHVFNDVEDEDGEDEYHQLSLLHKRRNLLAGYCKLILYSALQLRSASDVFRHYVKFYRDYGDIIKELLQKSRIINKEGSTRTLLLSLTQAYTALCSEENMPPHRTAPSFLEIRELARRFSLLLGPDQIRIREDIVLLHKEGLRFSLKASPGSEWSSQNLTFMDVLSEFSHKLLKQDKVALLQYLDQLCQQCPLLQRADDEDDDALRAPLVAYKKSLHTDSDGALATPSRRHGIRTETAESEAQPPSKRRKTKSKGAVEDPSANVEDRSRRPPPLMTSTVLKEKRPPPLDQAVEREPESAGSESDFEPSQSIIVRRHFRTPSSSRGMQTRTGTPSTLSGSLHRLHLMEEEEEIVIDEEESSSGSPGGETRLLDLLDAALLDSEEDQTLF